MKLAVATLAFFLAAFAASSARADDAPRLHTGASAVAQRGAEEAVERLAHPDPIVPAQADTRIEKPVRVQRGRKIVNIPERCRDAAGRYDLVVHFHGAPEMIEPVFQRAGIPAVFVVINLGIGSGPYEDAFIADGSLARLLDEVDGIVTKACPHPSGSRGRLALSAWSAGYGAAYRVLANKTDRELVDAVLLADGLHAGFLDKFRQQVNPGQMAPFDGFAERAVNGEKLFGITHTSIITPNYASTTETARYLEDKHGAERSEVQEAGPRPSMKLTSRADRGGLHVRGFAGNDTDAHCDHLYAIGDTLYPMLRERWTR